MSQSPNIIDKALAAPSWTEQDEAAVLSPYTYLTSAPSKETLRHMANALNDWLHVPADELNLIIKISQALQNDSLLFDDVEDGSALRRGRPVANSVFGVPQTVNAASYVVILVYQDAFTLRKMMETRMGTATTQNSPGEIITSELLNAHRGQGLDILWRDKIQCPTEDQYINMAKSKTTSLFRVLLRLMMASATEHKDVDYVPLVNLIGLVYQIRDDYCNLCDDTYNNTKGFAEDLTEGKFSFPIVHAINADKSNEELLDIIRQRPKTPTLKKRALEYIEEHTKSFEYTLGVLRTLQKRIDEEMDKLGGNLRLQKLLDKLRI